MFDFTHDNYSHGKALVLLREKTHLLRKEYISSFQCSNATSLRRIELSHIIIIISIHIALLYSIQYALLYKANNTILESEKNIISLDLSTA